MIDLSLDCFRSTFGIPRNDRSEPGLSCVAVLGCYFGDTAADERFLFIIQLLSEPFDHCHLRDTHSIRNLPLTDVRYSHLVSQVCITHFLHLLIDSFQRLFYNDYGIIIIRNTIHVNAFVTQMKTAINS